MQGQKVAGGLSQQQVDTPHLLKGILDTDESVVRFLLEKNSVDPQELIAKLDRLARSVVHLGEIVEGLEAKSVGLRILDLGLDTSTATGKLMLNVLGSVAQFEREMMLERQRDGIAKAKAQGKYKGRKPTAQAKKADVVAMLAEGRSKRDVARALGISERSVYRVA